MAGQIDSGVAEAVNGSIESSGEVSQGLLNHIEAAFAGAKNDVEGPGNETITVSQKEVDRRAAVKKEQTDELSQEGIEGDGETTEVKPAEADAAEEVADEAAPNEQAEPATPLDPNLRFVAQHYGWKDEDIDGLYEANPELATKTFENFLTAFQALSRQDGSLPNRQVPQQPVTAQQPQAPANTSKIDTIIGNLKEFAELNGEPIADFAKALNDELVVPFRQLQAELAVQKQQYVAAEARQTTDSLSEKFPDIYGKGDKLNLIEQQNRQNLYAVADQIRAGAYQQGKDVSVRDALNKAHLIIAADKMQSSARQQVQSQVQRRAKTITAKPTQRAKPGPSSRAQGEATAMEAYARRASEIGMDVGEF